MTFWPNDWGAILIPQAPLAELIVRGTIIYFLLLAMMRVGGRRLFARMSMADIIMMIVLAVAVRDGISGRYYTVGDAAISALTIYAWNRLVDLLAYRVPALRGLFRHAPLRVIDDGAIVEASTRSQLVTRDEILMKLRSRGVASVEVVGSAYLEPDGSFSVLRRG